MKGPALNRFARGRLWIGNLAIAGLLALIVLDALPTTPAPIRALVDPVVDRLGIWQGPWHLFSPNPDGQNHRFQAEITFHDGAKRIWHSPEWQQLSPAARFRKHREAEFLDHIWGIANEPAWGTWADHLVATQRNNNSPDNRPREIRMIIEVAAVPSIADDGWPPMDRSRDYADRWVLFTKKYP